MLLLGICFCIYLFFHCIWSSEPARGNSATISCEGSIRARPAFYLPNYPEKLGNTRVCPAPCTLLCLGQPYLYLYLAYLYLSEMKPSIRARPAKLPARNSSETPGSVSYCSLHLSTRPLPPLSGSAVFVLVLGVFVFILQCKI